MNNSGNLNNVVTDTEFFDNFLVDITTTNKDSFKKIEFFFNNKLGSLLGYIKIHILEGDSEKNNVRIIDVTSGSGYIYLSQKLKELYDENGYDDGNFIKGKASNFLSFVILYLRRNYIDRKVILVSCLEKNKQYLEPVIDDVKNRVGDIIESITGGGEFVSFTINLK
ncbi:MAG: hypothetical protein PHV23_00695 [Candidatus Gracilibacteria bacterium]|nr:hypothetical protein [Candidatus Gracilibacteria bacterium]